MVKIKYVRQYNRVCVEGHAQAGSKGEDLICAAVSILTRTLAENARQMEKAGLTGRVSIEIEDGHAYVRCPAKYGSQATVSSIMQAVCAGYQILADEFPEHVSFTVRG